MSFYSDIATDVIALLNEFGQAVTVRNITTGSYDPATGAAAETTSDTAAYGALFDYAERYIDGTTIIAGDRRLLLQAEGITTPTSNSRIIIGSQTWQVIRVKETNPAGTAVLLELQLRK